MKIKLKIPFIILVSLLFVSNLFVVLNTQVVAYDVEHFGYFDTPVKIIKWGGDQEEGSVFGKLDSHGDLVVTCYSKSFGVVGEDVYVIKYDTNYELQWNVSWATNDFARPADLAFDANNNIYIAGTIVTQIPPGTFTHDAFLLKYAPNGTLLWDEKRHIADQEDTVDCLTVASNDIIYVAGTTNNSNGFLFIQKYDSSGSYKTTYYHGETAPKELVFPGDLQIDSSGNIFIGGSTNNTPGVNYQDLVLIKLDSSGDLVWNTSYGGTNPADYGNDMILFNGAVYVVGGLGPEISPPGTDFDTLLVKFNATTGEIIWNVTWDLDNDFGKAIDINRHGNPVIVSTCDYMNGTDYIAVAEFLPNGTLLWDTSYRSEYSDRVSDISVESGLLYSIGSRYNTTSDYDIYIVVYQDHTFTDFPTQGPYGVIFGTIIGIILGFFAITMILGLLYTYWKKS